MISATCQATSHNLPFHLVSTYITSLTVLLNTIKKADVRLLVCFSYSFSNAVTKYKNREILMLETFVDQYGPIFFVLKFFHKNLYVIDLIIR